MQTALLTGLLVLPAPQKRVLAESVAMVPDSEKRLAKAIADLEELVVRPARHAPQSLSSLELAQADRCSVLLRLGCRRRQRRTWPRATSFKKPSSL